MGIKEEPFVVAQSVSVDNPFNDPDVIFLQGNTPTTVATVDVCVKQPQRTQVCIDSMVQVGVGASTAGNPTTFVMTYELFRNNTPIATINDEMDYSSPPNETFNYTNFPNFPVVDKDPIAGNNSYDLVCTRVTANESEVAFIGIGSRSLKATVITS
ncbi:hypothetical protein [Chengkuizengella axinellae]|uniref:DUF4489 domain-containing protein n=1 Tax=Chengkuizengella axinellae TaxID=3064388 RepID=A0ABT9J0W9_9BACL|nr:hypothetical protein [Chengkuizengella sp. 2205SS18-9]MDP5275128.1 hypothetical protein [Chengkuizengella sp. 2205SS18-9]